MLDIRGELLVLAGFPPPYSALHSWPSPSPLPRPPYPWPPLPLPPPDFDPTSGAAYPTPTCPCSVSGGAVLSHNMACSDTSSSSSSRWWLPMAVAPVDDVAAAAVGPLVAMSATATDPQKVCTASDSASQVGVPEPALLWARPALQFRPTHIACVAWLYR